jgi:hypothetical protein
MVLGIITGITVVGMIRIIQCIIGIIVVQELTAHGFIIMRLITIEIIL